MKSLFYFSFIFVILLLSCNKSETETKNELEHVSLKVEYGKIEFQSYSKKQYITKFNNILSQINSSHQQINTNEVESILLYGSDGLIKSLNFSIEMEDLLAISIFRSSQIPNKTNHDIIIRNKDGKFDYYDDLSISSKKVTSNSIKFICNYLHNNENILINEVVAILGPKINRRHNDDLLLRARLYKIRNIVSNENGEIKQRAAPDVAVQPACDDPCDDEGCDCQVYNLEEEIWICDPCVCGLREVEDSIVSRSVSLQDTINYQAYYYFRDSIMASTNFGIKYSHYYYMLSEYVFNNLSLSLSDYVEIYSLVPTANKIVKKINQYDFASSEHIISATDYNYIVDKVNHFKTFSSNLDYQSILSDIEYDLVLIKEKSLNQIIPLIN